MVAGARVATARTARAYHFVYLGILFNPSSVGSCALRAGALPTSCPAFPVLLTLLPPPPCLFGVARTRRRFCARAVRTIPYLDSPPHHLSVFVDISVPSCYYLLYALPSYPLLFSQFSFLPPPYFFPTLCVTCMYIIYTTTCPLIAFLRRLLDRWTFPILYALPTVFLWRGMAAAGRRRWRGRTDRLAAGTDVWHHTYFPQHTPVRLVGVGFA